MALMVSIIRGLRELRAAQGATGTREYEPVAMTPRLLTRAQAAHYCGLSTSTFDRWVARGAFPQAYAGTRRWDRVAIDRFLDRAAPPAAPQAEPTNPLDEWLAARAR